MPKIKATTVPEHRRAQRSALLDAAREIVLTHGTAALKFGELADRADLARPSVYEYFKTKDELVAALVDDELPSWIRDVSAALADAPSAEDTVAAFLRKVLELVRSGRHELPFALAEGELGDATRERIARAHAELFRQIAPALRELGVRDSVACLELLGGVITVAGQALRRDRGRRALVDATVRFAVAGVKALGAQR